MFSFFFLEEEEEEEAFSPVACLDVLVGGVGWRVDENDGEPRSSQEEAAEEAAVEDGIRRRDVILSDSWRD